HDEYDYWIVVSSCGSGRRRAPYFLLSQREAFTRAGRAQPTHLEVVRGGVDAVRYWRPHCSVLGALNPARRRVMSSNSWHNEITGAKAWQRLGLAVKSRIAFRPRPGVAQFHR